jgi:toxin ParE1/3/4
LRKIRWAPAAAADLESIFDYLCEHHSTLAQPTIQKLHAAALSLKRFPFRGRVGLLGDTRELVLPPLPYIIVYGVEPEAVSIFRIIHGAESRQ